MRLEIPFGLQNCERNISTFTSLFKEEITVMILSPSLIHSFRFFSVDRRVSPCLLSTHIYPNNPDLKEDQFLRLRKKAS